MFLIPTILRNLRAFLLGLFCLTLAGQAHCAVDNGDTGQLALIEWVSEVPGEAPSLPLGGEDGASDIFELELEEVLLDDSVWSLFVRVEAGVSPVRKGLVYRSGSSRGIDRPPQV